MEQHAGALDMAEESRPEPGAFVGILDQPGNVGQHELAIVEPDHAQIGG